MKKFSDFAKSNNILTGEKIKIDEVLNKEIEVIGFTIGESSYKKSNNDKLLTLSFIVQGENRILFTGSKILIKQCKEYETEMPFLASIQKINKFYTFV